MSSKSYDELKAEMEAIQQQMVEAKLREQEKTKNLTNYSTVEKLKNTLIENLDQIDDWMPYVMTFSNRLWFTKMIQQYEIWKLSQDVPGHVVELGVHFGESFLHFAKFC